MEISAKITGIEYTPFLCRKLKEFDLNNINEALNGKEATFILNVDKDNKFAVSWWVSAKRSRSYPFARVYDSLGFSGKRVTIIPIFKDEGKDGDRDFLQWDTISLMSLLGINVILSYYKSATKNKNYRNKITEQRYDLNQIKSEIKKLLSYHSDALHWNIGQINKMGALTQKAVDAYEEISKQTGVKMHSKASAEKRIAKLLEGKNAFMPFSRDLAQKAQKRESDIIQPKENVDGSKAKLTITNYLGGNYYFTSDEIKIDKSNITLIEAKHSEKGKLPALEDIREGLLKMVLFTNLKHVTFESKEYNKQVILKLTTGERFDINKLNETQESNLDFLKEEAKRNGFKVLINGIII